MAKVKAVPEGIRSITPQLNLNGAAEALDFYKRAFGAEEVMRAPDPSGKKIWHSQIRIGDSAVFVNDAFPEMGSAAQPASLWIYSDDVDSRWKRATEAGCTVKMPLADQFWGDRMGVCVDKWGVTWCLSQRIKEMTPDELKKAEQAFVASMKK
jgi:uncharacterized glyoxalase superfamily protein PhnB